MRAFLKSGSWCLLLLFAAACGKRYEALQLAPLQQEVSVLAHKPMIDKEMYRCLVNGKFLLKSFHLSGILIFKTLEDESLRAVFQNEMGFTFFDFQWDKNDSFQVLKIIPQLDKPALIKTLRKDLQLVLMKGLDAQREEVGASKEGRVHRFPLEKGFADYVTSDSGLSWIYVLGKRKVATITLSSRESKTAMPDKIFVQHHTAHFTIELNKMPPYAE